MHFTVVRISTNVEGYLSLKEHIELLSDAERAVRTALQRVPRIEIAPTSTSERTADFVVSATIREGQTWTLICELKEMAQPRQVRSAVYQLKRAIEGRHNVYPVLVAPRLSEESQQICATEGVGYVDLIGNWRLAFGGIFIERNVDQTRRAEAEERRELGSVFGLRSARAMRVLLQNPGHAWRVTELAKKAHVSVGQISNIRKYLLDHEWAERDPESSAVRIRKPDAILDAWQKVYSKRRPQRTHYYTVLHGTSLDTAIREAQQEAGNGLDALLSSFSAAKWIAPYARFNTERFAANEAGETVLKKHLMLESAPRGENVSIEHPKDEALFDDRIEAAPGIWCTGLIQTYLDLSTAGDRGREAAEHLRKMKLEPLWKKP
jgi:hypothetical protein